MKNPKRYFGSSSMKVGHFDDFLLQLKSSLLQIHLLLQLILLQLRPQFPLLLLRIHPRQFHSLKVVLLVAANQPPLRRTRRMRRGFGSVTVTVFCGGIYIECLKLVKKNCDSKSRIKKIKMTKFNFLIMVFDVKIKKGTEIVIARGCYPKI